MYVDEGKFILGSVKNAYQEKTKFRGSITNHTEYRFMNKEAFKIKLVLVLGEHYASPEVAVAEQVQHFAQNYSIS